MSKKCNDENIGRIKSIIFGTKKGKIQTKNLIAYSEYIKRKEKQPKL